MTDTYTTFSKETFAAFRADDRPGPIHMLNLIRLRGQAVYADGRRTTGAQAYAAYSSESEAVFKRVGGRIVWRGGLELTIIGPDGEHWDLSFIAEYPSPAAFAEMLRDPAYRAAMEHRQAAVADSRLVRYCVLPGGTSFNPATLA